MLRVQFSRLRRRGARAQWSLNREETEKCSLTITTVLYNLLDIHMYTNRKQLQHINVWVLF